MLLSTVAIGFLHGSLFEEHSPVLWEITLHSVTIGLFLMQILTLGSKINKRYVYKYFSQEVPGNAPKSMPRRIYSHDGNSQKFEEFQFRFFFCFQSGHIFEEHLEEKARDPFKTEKQPKLKPMT